MSRDRRFTRPPYTRDRIQTIFSQTRVVSFGWIGVSPKMGERRRLRRGLYKLAVRKAGFKDRELTIKVEGGNYRVKDLVLEEKS